MTVLESGKKGYGLHAAAMIRQGVFIIEYTGTYAAEKSDSAYQVLLKPATPTSPRIFLDARTHGSAARFINHGCEPNVKFEQWLCSDARFGTDELISCIGVFAMRDIDVGEELLVKYQQNPNFKCMCAAQTCSPPVPEKCLELSCGGFPEVKKPQWSKASQAWVAVCALQYSHKLLFSGGEWRGGCSRGLLLKEALLQTM